MFAPLMAVLLFELINCIPVKPVTGFLSLTGNKQIKPSWNQQGAVYHQSTGPKFSSHKIIESASTALKAHSNDELDQNIKDASIKVVDGTLLHDPTTLQLPILVSVGGEWYKVTKFLVLGDDSAVYEGKAIGNGTPVILKVFSAGRQARYRSLEAYKNELTVLSELKRLVGFDRNKLIIIQTLMKKWRALKSEKSNPELNSSVLDCITGLYI